MYTNRLYKPLSNPSRRNTKIHVAFVYGIRLILTLILGTALIIPMQSSIAIPGSQAWYVSPNGNDLNNCNTPVAPCATIQTALAKASSGDSIRISSGTYTGSGGYGFKQANLVISKNITLSGGWTSDFSTQPSKSILDGGNANRVIWVDENATVILDHLTIKNGQADSGAGIYNQGFLTLLYSTVEHNQAQSFCQGSGISQFGNQLTVLWSTISNNQCGELGGSGAGIYAAGGYPGETDIANSLINSNRSYNGSGIDNNQVMTITNTTISDNINNEYGSGGGIYNERGNLTILNSTIAGNDGGMNGGGLLVFDKSYPTYLKNTILANNNAVYGSDCRGAVSSEGFNIFGDNLGCDVEASTGDQLGADPRLAPLGNYGGPTQTMALYQDSPAIDSGELQGCKDASGAALTIDQRGSLRPRDGNKDGINRCDIGALEAEPDNYPTPPAITYLYVKPDGNDTNDCKTPNSACATINGAIAKAAGGNEVKITANTFTGTGNNVVGLDKNITLSGGWDSSFNHQSGKTVVDGEYSRRGIFIKPGLEVTIQNFTVQNGRSLDLAGGGIYVGGRSKINFTHLYLVNNFADVQDQTVIHSQDGGGLFSDSASKISIVDCRILNNKANGNGGGIAIYESNLKLSQCTVQGNSSFGDGGGVYAWGVTEISNSEIQGNSNFGVSGNGGGIYNQTGELSLKDSIVRNNTSLYHGGGIGGASINVDNSEVMYNKALVGGGISAAGLQLDKSAVVYNWAEESGGGMELYITNAFLKNSTIAKNLTYGDGGGIYDGNVEASNTTFYRNVALSHGGAFTHQVNLRNSLLSENWAQTGPTCYYSAVSMGYNLIDDTTGCNYTSGNGDIVNSEAMGKNLQGSPPYLNLMPDSPAIDGGDPSGCVDENGMPITSDQRGQTRPIDGNQDGKALCDIGATEYVPVNYQSFVYLPLLSTGSAQSAFKDDFSNPFSGWMVVKNTDAFARYTVREKYEISNKKGGQLYLIPSPYPEVADFHITVDINWANEGPVYGLLFGASENFDEFNLVEIIPMNQTIRIEHYQDQKFTEIVPQTFSLSIQMGANLNQVEVTKSGDQLTLLVNGSILGTWLDPVFGKVGITGLFASSFSGNTFGDADFDNFVLDNFSFYQASSSSLSPTSDTKNIKIITGNNDQLSINYPYEDIP